MDKLFELFQQCNIHEVYHFESGETRVAHLDMLISHDGSGMVFEQDYSALETIVSWQTVEEGIRKLQYIVDHKLTLGDLREVWYACFSDDLKEHKKALGYR